MEQNIYYAPADHLKRNLSIHSFQKYFLKSGQNLIELSRLIKECNIDNMNCRFNVWRLCLGVVTIHSSVQQKRGQITLSRQKYQEKKDQALKSINKRSSIKEPVKKNPLMMGGAKSLQNKEAESDLFLSQQIQKDVERTYQQMKFFQDKHILKLLSLILFVWCRRNPQVSYKQGMNELLASVVVCYFKQVQFKHEQDRPDEVSQQLWSDHLLFNSVDYAQSEIYSIFEKIIQIQGDMYKTQADLTIKSKVNPNSKNNTPILQRIMHIKDHKLKHMDLQLFRIIKLQDVQTKTFLLRWIRCMHTRQFDLQNSFVIWDSIFLEFLESQNSLRCKQFQFIDAMCIAMFMYMRSIVFTKQTAGEILQIYQKYPALKRGQYLDELITLAWSICEQLRNQTQNSQTSQSNWFEESEKVQSLHFMQKKPQKKPSEPQPKIQQANSRKQPVQKQLKQHEHKKQPQIIKKHSYPVDHNTTTKVKQSGIEYGEVNGGIQEQVYQQAHKQKSEQIEQIKEQIPESKHKQEQFISSDISNVKSPGPYATTIKVPQTIGITLCPMQVSEILEHLTQSLPNIRDIDAQSHIRKIIKKIQGKVKVQRQKQQQQAKNKQNKGFPLKPLNKA